VYVICVHSPSVLLQSCVQPMCMHRHTPVCTNAHVLHSSSMTPKHRRGACWDQHAKHTHTHTQRPAGGCNDIKMSCCQHTEVVSQALSHMHHASHTKTCNNSQQWLGVFCSRQRSAPHTATPHTQRQHTATHTFLQMLQESAVRNSVPGMIHSLAKVPLQRRLLRLGPADSCAT
jgi:hypothetical protein